MSVCFRRICILWRTHSLFKCINSYFDLSYLSVKGLLLEELPVRLLAMRGQCRLSCCQAQLVALPLTEVTFWSQFLQRQILQNLVCSVRNVDQASILPGISTCLPWIQLNLKYKLFRYSLVFNLSKSIIGLKHKSVKVHVDNVTYFLLYLLSDCIIYYRSGRSQLMLLFHVVVGEYNKHG